MKVVILCGGKGERLREETERIPKPLVNIGNMPIISHIMKIYSHQGFNDFILCLGHKGDLIKKYFLDYKDIKNEYRDIKFVDTGINTNTGGRIKKIEKYINDENFFVTYSDGLINIDLHKLFDYHKDREKIATVTAVKTLSPFGIIEVDNNYNVINFIEKPLMDKLINGGFFVFNKEIFSYISGNDKLEIDVLPKLTALGKVCAYPFNGFWHSMDTFRDKRLLNEMWQSGNAPWRIWK